MTTRPNRSPEIVLKLSYDHRIDTWAVGCLFFRILALDNLFKPRKSGSGTYTIDEDHLAQVIELLGPLPLEVLAVSSQRNVFLMKLIFRNFLIRKEISKRSTPLPTSHSRRSYSKSTISNGH